MQDHFGLYLHIPFCANICHYCDFAKSANYYKEHTDQYFHRLEQDFSKWAEHFGTGQKFTSVYLGGGTPGLFSSEYERLFEKIAPHLDETTEITLEANPQNVTPETIRIWKNLGINRVSLGVQTFDEHGLKQLTRDHDAATAMKAIQLVAQEFEKHNFDLIYGWPGQTKDILLQDLQKIQDLGVTHVSAYALTFEGNTPFVRAQERGKMKAPNDDVVADFYELICDKLEKQGFEQEEVSNWSKGKGSCRHNWLYWKGDSFLGLGAGAHGFFKNEGKVGLRYNFPKDFRTYLRHSPAEKTPNASNDLNHFLYSIGAEIDDLRDLKSWLYETVGTSFRTISGVPLDFILTKGFVFNPTTSLKLAMDQGSIQYVDGYLKSNPKEWFRETRWSFEICESILPR